MSNWFVLALAIFLTVNVCAYVIGFLSLFVERTGAGKFRLCLPSAECAPVAFIALISSAVCGYYAHRFGTMLVG